MSGMKNLANAMANDPSFKADGLLSKSEAGQYVPQSGGGIGKKSSSKTPPMGKSSKGGY